MVVASVDGMKYKLINKKTWPKILIHKWLFSVFYFWHQILYSTRHTEIIQSIIIGFQLFIAIFFHLVYKELQEGAVREKDTIFYCSILLTWFIILYYIILFYQKLIFWMYFVFYIEIRRILFIHSLNLDKIIFFKYTNQNILNYIIFHFNNYYYLTDKNLLL